MIIHSCEVTGRTDREFGLGRSPSYDLMVTGRGNAPSGAMAPRSTKRRISLGWISSGVGIRIRSD